MGGSASSTPIILIEREAREARPADMPGGEADLSDTRASSERRTRFSDSRAATCSSLVPKRLRSHQDSTRPLGASHGLRAGLRAVLDAISR